MSCYLHVEQGNDIISDTSELTSSLGSPIRRSEPEGDVEEGRIPSARADVAGDLTTIALGTTVPVAELLAQAAESRIILPCAPSDEEKVRGSCGCCCVSNVDLVCSQFCREESVLFPQTRFEVFVKLQLEGHHEKGEDDEPMTLHAGSNPQPHHRNAFVILSMMQLPCAISWPR